jgi:uncharacterized protein (TIGR03435 family)
MTANEPELKHFVDRHLPSPTHMEFSAARDRFLDQLRATPAHLQRARIAESTPPVSRGAPLYGTPFRWRTVVTLAAAAALIALIATVPFQHTDWIATVEAADGSSYPLETNTVLSATDSRGLQLTLKDGSRVEMRSASELSLERAADGIGIRLRAGDIIVNAAPQGHGHLSVSTSDMTISVDGTVFLVKTVADGSRVAVIEGEVRVRARGTPLRRSGRPGAIERRLHPGEEVSTSPALAARPLREDIVWSRHADAHLAILDSFTRGLSRTSGALTPLARQADVAGAQTPGAQAAALEFEEASIRQCDPDNLPPSPVGARGGGANSVMMTPGRFYALCVTPATLIRSSHGYRAAEIEALLPDGLPRRGGRAPIRGQFGVVGSIGAESGLRIRGGPDWVRKERYTIEAIADSSATTEAMSGPMLRALFARRFKLKTHVETEQTAAFDLVVAPGGLKIKPVASGACEIPPARPGLPLLNGMPQPLPRSVADARRAAKPLCGISNGPNGPNCVSIGGESTLVTLTQSLRGVLGNGLGVTDKTGTTDKFNWDLEYAVDGNAPTACRGILTDSAVGNVPRGATIFDALEQQLGLRLEPVQVPREYLVIDAIERPGPN